MKRLFVCLTFALALCASYAQPPTAGFMIVRHYVPATGMGLPPHYKLEVQGNASANATTVRYRAWIVGGWSGQWYPLCNWTPGTPSGTATMDIDLTVSGGVGTGVVVRQVVSNGFGADSADIGYNLTCNTTSPPVQFWITAFVGGGGIGAVAASNENSSLKDVWISGAGFSMSCTQMASCSGPVPHAGPYQICVSYNQGTCYTPHTQCTTVYVPCFAPPMAGFSYQSPGTNVYQFTNTSTGSGITGIQWAFGDGGTSSASNPQHTYAVAGTYQVCLTVTDSCGSDAHCVWITTCPVPNAGFTASANTLTVSFSNTTTGTVGSQVWDFGDGTGSTGVSPTHTYSAAGTYQVCLITTNSCGADTACQSIQVVCPVPNSGFTAGTSGLLASFTNTTSGTVSSQLWDFGDGSTSTILNPQHTYAANGIYTVCLVNTNHCGSDTICQTITVGCVAPLSGFSQSSSYLTATFANTSTGSPAAYAWDFGDGTTSTAASPTHSYAAAGTYIVCLTSTNVCGSDTACQTVTLTCPAPIANFTYATNGLTILVNDSSTNLVQPMTVSFSFGDGTQLTGYPLVHTYSQPGFYQVCEYVTTPCGMDTSCTLVAVGITGIADIGDAEFTVMPNPNAGQFRVEAMEVPGGDVAMEVMNALGQVVETRTWVHGGGGLVAAVEVPAAGVYFVRLRQGNSASNVRKVVVMD